MKYIKIYESKYDVPWMTFKERCHERNGVNKNIGINLRPKLGMYKFLGTLQGVPNRWEFLGVLLRNRFTDRIKHHKRLEDASMNFQVCWVNLT